MRNAFKYSILLHVFIVSLLCLHVPNISNHLVKENVIAVEIVSHADFTNLYNKTVKNKSDHEDLKLKDLKPEPAVTKIETATQPLPQQQIQPPTPKLDVKSPVKPLKDVKSTSVEQKNAKKPKAKESVPASSSKTYDSDLPLTMSEVDNIKTQIEAHFSMTIMQDFKPGEIIIKLRLQMSELGEVKQVIPLVSDSKYPMKHAQIFEALKDRLVRAAHAASPLQNLPREKYNGARGWREIELSFDAYSLMNY